MQIKVKKIDLLLFSSAVMGSGIGYGKFWLFHMMVVGWIVIRVLVSQNSNVVFFVNYGTRKYFLCFILLIAYYLFSSLWSPDFLYSIKYVAYLAMGFFLIFSIVSYSTDITRFDEAINFIGATFCIAVFIGFLESFTPFRLPTSPYSNYAHYFNREFADFNGLDISAIQYISSSPTSFWGNPNNFALALLIIYPFFLFYKKKWIKLGGIILIPLLIIMAGSRGVLISLFFGIPFCIFLADLKGKLKSLLMVGALIFFALSINPFLNEMDSLRAIEIKGIWETLLNYLDLNGQATGSVGVRQELIREGINIFFGSYGFGVGAGGSQYILENNSTYNNSITSMHNFWLEILAESGVIGIILFVYIFGSLLAELYKISKASKDIKVQYYAKSFFISNLVFVIGCVSASSVIYFLPMYILFGLSIAFIGIRKKAAYNFKF